MNSLTLRENEARNILKSQMSVLNTLTNKDEARASIFASAILSQVTNKNLINCDLDSIIKNGIEIVRLGLNPNPNFGQAYIVPFKTKNGGEIAQLQIGFKGFLNLAYRNGWIFRAVCVYACDKFKIEFAGISDKITYEPNFEARQDDNHKWIHSNLIGVIVYAMDSNKTEFSEFVPFSKLEKLRLKSQNQNDKNELKYIWAEWSEEMYKAKALKYVATRLPITEQIQNAISSENAVYSDNANLTQKRSYSENPNNSQNLDLNAIAEAEVEAEVVEVEPKQTQKEAEVAKSEKPPFSEMDDGTQTASFASAEKKRSVGYVGKKAELLKLLTEQGLSADEAIDFISKVANTSQMAEALLNDKDLLSFKLKEFFKN